MGDPWTTHTARARPAITGKTMGITLVVTIKSKRRFPTGGAEVVMGES
jgi:hypothetical protein